MGMKLEYFTNHYGFTFFSISKKEITVSFVGADGSVIYQYTRNNKVHPLPTLPTVTSTSPTRPVGKTFLMRWHLCINNRQLVIDTFSVSLRKFLGSLYLHLQPFNALTSPTNFKNNVTRRGGLIWTMTLSVEIVRSSFLLSVCIYPKIISCNHKICYEPSTR